MAPQQPSWLLGRQLQQVPSFQSTQSYWAPPTIVHRLAELGFRPPLVLSCLKQEPPLR